jgi:hypothetical protein
MMKRRKLTRVELEHRTELRIMLTVVLTIVFAIVISGMTVAESMGTTPAGAIISALTTPEPIESWG